MIWRSLAVLSLNTCKLNEFRVLSLKCCGKSKTNGGVWTPGTLALWMYPVCCCLLTPVHSVEDQVKGRHWSRFLILIFVLFFTLLIFGAPILLPPNMSREISSPGLKEYEISNSVSVWQNVTSGISGLNWALVWGALPSPYLISGLSLHQGPLTQELSPHWQPGQVSSHKTKCVRWSKEKCT